MKIQFAYLTQVSEPSVCLEWQMPGQDSPSSMYLYVRELTPAQYPHAVKDLSRIAVFYGDRFVLFHAPADFPGQDAASTTRRMSFTATPSSCSPSCAPSPNARWPRRSSIPPGSIPATNNHC